MFRDFLGFLVAAGLSVYQVTVVTLLAFMESLVQQEFSVSNIVNYMAGIRSYFIIYGLNTSPFRDERLHLFQKSLKYTRKFVPKTTTIINTDLLLSILSAYATLPFPSIYRALYLLSLFSFLRLSNIFPHTIKNFDVTTQLCRGDLIFSQDSIVVIIKWSKTIQNRRDTVTISVPSLGDSPLCPYQALKLMLLKIPGSPNEPLFQIPRKGVLVPLTDSAARKHLEFRLCLALCIYLTPASFTSCFYLQTAPTYLGFFGCLGLFLYKKSEIFLTAYPRRHVVNTCLLELKILS